MERLDHCFSPLAPTIEPTSLGYRAWDLQAIGGFWGGSPARGGGGLDGGERWSMVTKDCQLGGGGGEHQQWVSVGAVKTSPTGCGSPANGGRQGSDEGGGEQPSMEEDEEEKG